MFKKFANIEAKTLGRYYHNKHKKNAKKTATTAAGTMALSMESIYYKTQSFITNTIASTTATGKLSDNLWNVGGKTCIVTGATSGIGLQTALDLVKRGARVILGCRNGQAAEEAIIYIRRYAGLKTAEQAAKLVTWSHLDLASLSSVRRFAEEIIRNEPKLHVLINNAAVMTGRQRQVRLEGNLEVTFATNHLGPFLLTNLLLPLIKASAPSRIINVASDCYKMCRKLYSGQGFNFNDLQYETTPKDFDPWTAYCQSKLANILFTRALNWKLNGAGHCGVSVFAVHPGLCRTQLFRNQSRAFLLFFGPLVGHFGKTAKDGARTPIYCATQPGLQDFSGRFLSKCRVKQLQQFAMDDAMACKLWSQSERLAGIGDGKSPLITIRIEDTTAGGKLTDSFNSLTSATATSPPPLSTEPTAATNIWGMRRSITESSFFVPHFDS